MARAAMWLDDMPVKNNQFKTLAVEAAEEEMYRLAIQSKIPRNKCLPTLSWCDLEVDSMVGVGGFSRVFKANIESLAPAAAKSKLSSNNHFAVKCLRTNTMEDRTLFQIGIADLCVEGDILSRVQHENIVQLHAMSAGGPRAAFLEDPRGYFLVLDFLVGGTLTNQLKKYRSTSKRVGSINGVTSFKSSHSTIIRRLKEVGLGVARGIAHLHSKNIVARDIKPDNIGFDADGTPKLFDLGFARELHSIEEGDMAGSPRYMAPEVGLHKETSLNSDVYSFGVVLWELLTLRKPFDRVSNTRVRFVNEVYLKNYRPSTSSIPSTNLRKLIKACWHHDVEARPTMEEVIETIENEIEEAEIKVVDSGDHRRQPVVRCHSFLGSSSSTSSFWSSWSSGHWSSGHQRSIVRTDVSSGHHQRRSNVSILGDDEKMILPAPAQEAAGSRKVVSLPSLLLSDSISQKQETPPTTTRATVGKLVRAKSDGTVLSCSMPKPKELLPKRRKNGFQRLLPFLSHKGKKNEDALSGRDRRAVRASSLDSLLLSRHHSRSGDAAAVTSSFDSLISIQESSGDLVPPMQRAADGRNENASWEKLTEVNLPRANILLLPPYSPNIVDHLVDDDAGQQAAVNQTI